MGLELVERAFDGRHRDVERLIAEGADLTVTERNGYSAISEAAVAGHTVVIGQLLRALADPNQAAQDGRIALHRAAFHGWKPAVQLLLEHGGDPTLKDNDGKIAADLARNGLTRKVLLDFPAEKTKELQEERRKQLSRLPPPEPDELEDLDSAVAKSPPGAAENLKAAKLEKEAEAKKQAELRKQEEKEKDQRRERLFREAMADLAEQDMSTEEQIPLTAHVEVRGAGEGRVNGTYKVNLAYKDQIEFRKLGDDNCQLYWSQWNDEWRIVAGDYKMGYTLYRHVYRPKWKVDESFGVPEGEWQKWFGKEPVPLVKRLGDEPPNAALASPEPASALPNDAEASEAREPELRPEEEQYGEASNFLELHSRLEIVTVDGGVERRKGEAVLAAQDTRVLEVGLGGHRVVETEDGLFGADEVEADVQIRSSESRAAAWLDNPGSLPEVPADWDAISSAKSISQELHREGKGADARRATTAAIHALRRLERELRAKPYSLDSIEDNEEDSDEPGEDGKEDHSPKGPILADVEALQGVLHSNRSLLLLNQIQAGDEEVLAFGVDAAWRLVVGDCDLALRANAKNFKASFRRARALFELGELHEALVDATVVVDHYSRNSQTANPEAAALREQIQQALRSERSKWGGKAAPAWNAVVSKSLVEDLGDQADPHGPASTSSRVKSHPSPWEGVSAASPLATSARTAAVVAKALPAPKTAGEVEKALLTTLKSSEERQLAYLKEHLSPTVFRRLFRKVPLGPDMLALLVHLVGMLAEEDVETAGQLVGALAATPAASTHTAMFSKGEKAELQKLLDRVGSDAASIWERVVVAAGGGA